jgi:cystathionine gamma-synthase
MRTLHTRIKQQELNTHEIVKALSAHSFVSKVYYPGLENHEGYEIATRQQKGYGAMVSFELKGDLENVKLFLQKINLFTLAESLGGVESLIAHPVTMTHAAMTPEALVGAGIRENLLRVSVGLESPEDLVTDITEALNFVFPQ